MTATSRQHTLSNECVFDPGAGLHSGATIRMRCLPAPEGAGIRFRRTDLPDTPEAPARLEFIQKAHLNRRTALRLAEGAEVNTIEHLMAACHALGIDNLLVELDGPELPFFDGSAVHLSERLMETGLAAQAAPREFFPVRRPFVFREEDVEIVALPSEALRLTFFADYPSPALGVQAASYEIGPDAFLKEIAPARTFCMLEEVEGLRRQGLIHGGNPECAIVFGKSGPLNTTLRYPDEPARHKLLDLLGDLYLLGRPLRGHVMASLSGHRTHSAFLEALRKDHER